MRCKRPLAATAAALALTLTILTLALPAVAAAAPGVVPVAGRNAHFIDMSVTVLKGHVQRPQTINLFGRSRAIFDPLLRLKRSFMRDISHTGAERALK